MDLLPESFRPELIKIFDSWQLQIAQCLDLAKEFGEINKQADSKALAQYFWTGWEGAVSRARLEQSSQPLDNYIQNFMTGLPR